MSILAFITIGRTLLIIGHWINIEIIFSLTIYALKISDANLNLNVRARRKVLFGACGRSWRFREILEDEELL